MLIKLLRLNQNKPFPASANGGIKPTVKQVDVTLKTALI
jgi:hypothetical protein